MFLTLTLQRSNVGFVYYHRFARYRVTDMGISPQRLAHDRD